MGFGAERLALGGESCIPSCSEGLSKDVTKQLGAVTPTPARGAELHFNSSSRQPESIHPQPPGGVRGAPGRDAGQVRVGRVRVGLSPLPGPLPVLLPDPLPVLLPVLLSDPLPVLLPGPLPGPLPCRWLSARGNSPFPRPDGTSPAAGRAWPRGGVRRSAAWLFCCCCCFSFFFSFCFSFPSFSSSPHSVYFLISFHFASSLQKWKGEVGDGGGEGAAPSPPPPRALHNPRLWYSFIVLLYPLFTIFIYYFTDYYFY